MKWRRAQDPRVRDELRYHRDRLIDDYVAAGMDRASAERRAFLEFGNVPGLEEQVRDARFFLRRPQFDVLELNYAEMCRSARPEALRMAAFLGDGLDVEKMVGVVDVQLYRNRS